MRTTGLLGLAAGAVSGVAAAGSAVLNLVTRLGRTALNAGTKLIGTWPGRILIGLGAAKLLASDPRKGDSEDDLRAKDHEVAMNGFPVLTEEDIAENVKNAPKPDWEKHDEPGGFQKLMNTVSEKVQSAAENVMGRASTGLLAAGVASREIMYDKIPNAIQEMEDIIQSGSPMPPVEKTEIAKQAEAESEAEAAAEDGPEF